MSWEIIKKKDSIFAPRVIPEDFASSIQISDQYIYRSFKRNGTTGIFFMDKLVIKHIRNNQRSQEISPKNSITYMMSMILLSIIFSIIIRPGCSIEKCLLNINSKVIIEIFNSRKLHDIKMIISVMIANSSVGIKTLNFFRKI